MTTTSNPRRARWDRRTAAPINSIVAGEAIVAVVVVVIVVIAVVDVVVSRNVAGEDGVSGAVPPLSSLLSSAAAQVALYLIPRPLIVRHSIIALSHPDRFAMPFHHRPPVHTPPITFLCRFPPLLIVICLPLMLRTIVVPRRLNHWTWMTSLFVVIAAVIFSSPPRPPPLHSISAFAPC